jgi:hypothetical protein
MGFRRSPTTDPESSRWRLAHRGLLLECGIPEEIANSDRRWIYLLLHGSDDFGTRWDPTWISSAQARRLLNRLESELASENAYQLIHFLRKRSGEGQ